MKIKENISLKKFCTYKVGGPARYFVEPETKDELLEAVHLAKKEALPYLVLGGGSNILIPTKGYPGIIIKPKFAEIKFSGNNVHAGASITLAVLIDKALQRDLTGLEFAAGIPGTVGGAIRGNAGTYGVSMSDVLVSISALDTDDGSLIELKASQCDFAYRHSIFKKRSFIIISCILKLIEGGVGESRRLIEDRLKQRRESHPLEPSAGCTFKNIEFNAVDLDKISEKGLDISKFEKFRKIPAGYLIDNLGLKGKTIGGAQISEKHANYIININNATFEDIITLISYIKQQVRNEYSVQLQEEIQIIN